MENHVRSQVLGSTGAPYLSSLADACGTAANYRSIGSPSLPNYLGATSGTTSGIADDASPASHPLTIDNVFRQVRRAGGTAVTYAESMPRTCTLDGSGRYAVKHNPAAYYTGDDDRDACNRDDRPVGSASALLTALTTQSLPTFTMVVPDLCHDTHDCSVATGDQWLSSWLPSFLGSDAYRGGDTVVFVVWDEPTPMPFVAVAPTIAAGATERAPVDHYALLRTTEDLLGIEGHLGTAATAPSMRGALGI